MKGGRDMKRKIVPLSLSFYLLAVIFIVFGILSVIACHQNVIAQLSQGIPIKGNELAIISLYLQSGAQYLAYTALLFIAGWDYQLLYSLKLKETVPPQPDEVSESINSKEHSQGYREQVDEGEDNFQNWDADFIRK